MPIPGGLKHRYPSGAHCTPPRTKNSPLAHPHSHTTTGLHTSSLNLAGRILIVCSSSPPSGASKCDLRVLMAASFADPRPPLLSPSFSLDLTTSTACPCRVLIVLIPTPGRYRLSTPDVRHGIALALALPPSLLAMGLMLLLSLEASFEIESLLLMVGANLTPGASDARGEASSELVTLLLWLGGPRDRTVMLLLSGDASLPRLEGLACSLALRTSAAAWGFLRERSPTDSTGPCAAEEEMAGRPEAVKGRLL
mmetsp:Transcript_23337/g.54253  ORF Transcript_23337/g.54253 Transcript_23337/m.54253 type:complete len:253 (-) Transcript_23337:353-1111(-)